MLVKGGPGLQTILISCLLCPVAIKIIFPEINIKQLAEYDNAITRDKQLPTNMTTMKNVDASDDNAV